MYDHFRKFDLWVLDNIIDPASWRVEWWTGLTCFQQARMVLSGYLASRYATDVIFDNEPHRVAYALFFLALCYGVSLMVERRSKDGLNPERCSHVNRLFWWSMIFYFGICENLTHRPFGQAIVGSVADISALLFVYLLACSAPPPKPRTEFSGKLAPIPTNS